MNRGIAKYNLERVISLPDADIAARYLSGETIQELAVAFAVSTPTITKSLNRSGVQRRPAKVRPGIISGAKNPAWRGGLRKRRDGYLIRWTPDGEILEHRRVMQEHLGRPLTDEEIVHHDDHDKSNNDLGNLIVMTQAEHAALHAPELLRRRNGHRGASNPRAKLSEDNVAAIRESSLSGRSLGRIYGVHPSTIQRIKNGEGWLS